MFYFVKTPWWLKKLYPSCVWDIPVKEKILYLTFDDGPHPEVTPFVLDQLQQYNAKATFFCIGKNVAAHPEIYRRVLDEGHRTGNHTNNHLNGWKVTDELYLQNILTAGKYIDSNLFRPPYGRITRFQVKLLTGIRNSPANNNFSIIMWDVLSGDFDVALSGETCSINVIKQAQPGSVVVFHDSEKAFPRLKEALPKTLQYFSEKGYRFEAIGL
jgi:peptidoglycan/xylan/chitin deacetylase (PgdA/CDA1 family)